MRCLCPELHRAQAWRSPRRCPSRLLPLRGSCPWSVPTPLLLCHSRFMALLWRSCSGEPRCPATGVSLLFLSVCHSLSNKAGWRWVGTRRRAAIVLRRQTSFLHLPGAMGLFTVEPGLQQHGRKRALASGLGERGRGQGPKLGGHKERKGLLWREVPCLEALEEQGWGGAGGGRGRVSSEP